MLAALALVAALATDPAAERDFLAANATAAGVVTAPAMQYRVLTSGPASGAHPTRNSAVKVRYAGRYIDGEVFDPGPPEAIVFQLKSLIPGYQQALTMMRPGDRWEIYVPPELAYGWIGKPPSGRTLIFRLELIDWAEAPPTPSPILLELPKK